MIEANVYENMKQNKILKDDISYEQTATACLFKCFIKCQADDEIFMVETCC